MGEGGGTGESPEPATREQFYVRRGLSILLSRLGNPERSE
jgi:hypothetical protein